MRRREFITGLGVVSAWPHIGQAQVRSKPYRIGFLSQQPGQSSLFSRTFVEALRDLGYVEGQNTTANTTGPACPCRCKTRAETVLLARMTSGARLTSSFAQAAVRCSSPPPI